MFWSLKIREGLFLSKVPLKPSQISATGWEVWVAQSYISADLLARVHQLLVWQSLSERMNYD